MIGFMGDRMINAVSEILTFPQMPEGFPPLDPGVDPVFDPDLHLLLEQPGQIFSLADLGYDEERLRRRLPHRRYILLSGVV